MCVGVFGTRPGADAAQAGAVRRFQRGNQDLVFSGALWPTGLGEVTAVAVGGLRCELM